MSVAPTKCATLKHGGRFGGSLSPNPKNVAQPSIQPPPPAPPQHLQLQQHHLLQKPNNQQLEIQTYQIQQPNYQHQQQQLQQQHQQQQQQNFNVATVSRDYNQHYPSATLPYQKPGAGFTETSSILKKHRDEINELNKPPSQTVFSIDASTHRQTESRSSKSISIINQPLPEIPKHQQLPSNPQVLSAANLDSYRSLQRPQSQKLSYPSGTTQRNRDRDRDRERDQKMSSSVRIPAPPVLPPKNRQQQQLRGSQSSNQSYQLHQQQQQQQPQYPSKGYDRERSRDRGERDRDRMVGRSYDDSHQYRTSSKQHQQQQNFQTLPHHHHHTAAAPYSLVSQATSVKSNRKSDSSKYPHRSSREMTQPRFENYSATEL